MYTGVRIEWVGGPDQDPSSMVTCQNKDKRLNWSSKREDAECGRVCLYAPLVPGFPPSDHSGLLALVYSKGRKAEVSCLHSA